jgi:predicted O-methyltransferase YrrM
MYIPIYFEGALNDHRNFPRFFEKAKYFKDKPIKILHLGAYTGHGTRWMLERVNGSCVDVDTWIGSRSEDGHADGHENFYDSSIEALYDAQTRGLNTVKFKGTTSEFFKQNKETFDFIYIDASHKKADVAADLEESFKILNPGGVIACDDYLWRIDLESYLRPKDAIDEFIAANSDKVEVIIKNYQLWFKKL